MAYFDLYDVNNCILNDQNFNYYHVNLKNCSSDKLNKINECGKHLGSIYIITAMLHNNIFYVYYIDNKKEQFMTIDCLTYEKSFHNIQIKRKCDCCRAPSLQCINGQIIFKDEKIYQVVMPAIELDLIKMDRGK